MDAEWQRGGMNRWLSFEETCFELRLGPRAVLKMLKHGVLVGYRVPAWERQHNRVGPWGKWRILDPNHKFAKYLDESRRHVEHVPLLSNREVAEIVGLTPSAIRQLKKRKRLCGTTVNNQTLYTAAEIRQFLLRDACRFRRVTSRITSVWLNL